MKKTASAALLCIYGFLHVCMSASAVANESDGSLEYLLGVEEQFELQDIKASTQWSISNDGWIREVFSDVDFWFGEYPKVAWLKYTPNPNRSSHWIELASSGATRAELYYTDRSQVLRKLSTEDPEYLSGYRPRFLSFLLTEKMLAQPLYIRVESSSKMHLQVNIHDYFDFIQSSSLLNFIYAIGYGIVLIMVLYNLILGWYLKDPLYYAYSVAVFSALYYQFFAHGHARIFFNLNWDGVNQSLNVASLVAIATAMYFLYHYANFSVHFNKVAKFFKGLIVSVLIAIISMFFLDQNASLNLLLVISGPMLTMAVALTLWARFKGVKEAGYFAIAWLGYILAGGIWLSYWLGILPLNNYVEMPLLVGAVLESVLLSLALGYRIQTLNAQTQLLEASESHYKNLSRLDPLTKLANRRAFDTQVSYYEQRVIDYGLVLIDIDEFKKFNDKYGHLEGDKVLIVLSEVLRDCIRNNDLAARLGGEEFGLLITNASIEQLKEISERARTIFEAHEFIIDGVSQYCTISVGLGSHNFLESKHQFINRVDQALYLAKEKGRNQVQIAAAVC